MKSISITAPLASPTSSEPSRTFTLDRWSQRRLQRLNAEQVFREQRQNSKDDSASAVTSGSTNGAPTQGSTQPQGNTAAQDGGQHLARQQTRSPPILDSQAVSPPTRFAFPESQPQRLANTSRLLPHSISVPHLVPFELAGDTPSVNMAAPSPQPSKSPRTGRHAALASSSTTQVATAAQTNGTIPPKTADGAPPEELTQLRKDHKELREKYTKVKKFYFEKEEQVKQLQNVLAHQRIAQHRTVLDDHGYGTRLERLDGLIKQLAYVIRRSWKSVPSWLSPAINKDAVETGKQEMTAAGRAYISWWVNSEIFDKYFHPDIDKLLSEQLKIIEKNIRLAATPSTAEEDATLSAKIVEWRLTTLDGLQSHLRSDHAVAHRRELTEQLTSRLTAALNAHLLDPPASDLAGGAAMIVELAVAMTASLPSESRDVQIEYFMPGAGFDKDTMVLGENGIPVLDDEGGARTSLDGKREKKAATVTANSSSRSLVDEDERRVRMAMGLSARVRGRDVLFRAQVHVL